MMMLVMLLTVMRVVMVCVLLSLVLWAMVCVWMQWRVRFDYQVVTSPVMSRSGLLTGGR